jgi:hypothetical protein
MLQWNTTSNHSKVYNKGPLSLAFQQALYKLSTLISKSTLHSMAITARSKQNFEYTHTGCPSQQEASQNNLLLQALNGKAGLLKRMNIFGEREYDVREVTNYKEQSKAGGTMG